MRSTKMLPSGSASTTRLIRRRMVRRRKRNQPPADFGIAVSGSAANLLAGPQPIADPVQRLHRIRPQRGELGAHAPYVAVDGAVADDLVQLVGGVHQVV